MSSLPGTVATSRPGLEISSPADPYEREADLVADQVMRTADQGNPGGSGRGQGHQERGGAGAAPEAGHPGLGGDRARNHRTDAPFGPISGVAPSAYGRPLDTPTRAFMEPRFGHDFSRVRVHIDRHAGLLARRFGARAFTSGRDIFFGEGQYSPATARGRHLIAHELAHVAQKLPVIARRPDDGPIPAPELETRGPLWHRAQAYEPALRPHVPRTPPVSGWGSRVLLAIGERTEARRDRAYLQLINEALAPDRNRFPGLRFPVTGIRTEGQARHGGVYYALGQGYRPGQTRIARAVTITRRGRRGGPNPRVFIAMTGGALDPDSGPDFTRRILHHEYIHFVQNTQGLLTRRPACRVTWKGRRIGGNPNREVVATSTTFARFFAGWTDRSPPDSTDYPHYLYEDLALLFAHFRCAEDTVRGPAIARIATMAAGRRERRRHLLNLLIDVRDSALPNINLSYSDNALARIATAIGVSLEPDPRLPARPRSRTPLFDIDRFIERSRRHVREQLLESAP